MTSGVMKTVGMLFLRLLQGIEFGWRFYSTPGWSAWRE
jgi:hypothetical protein